MTWVNRIKNRLQGENLILRDVLGSSKPKKVLLSYITFPFIYGVSSSHTNLEEVWIIARVFDELGYRVDVQNFYRKKEAKYDEYDVVFGFGHALEIGLTNRKESTGPKFVAFETGSHPYFQNDRSLRRLRESFEKTGLWMWESSRILEHVFIKQVTSPDLLIVKGDDFVKSTYTRYGGIAPNLIKTFVHQMPLPSGKLDQTRKNSRKYLWFGGGGAIHKGLDLVLESFKELPHLELHICANLDKERKFADHYHRHLHQLPNVKYHGFVGIDSPLFLELMETSAFIIFPSCSEANCASVVTTMYNGGLIPVVTASTGVEVKENGYEIHELSVEGVNDAIDRSQELDQKQLIQSADELLQKSKEIHSPEAFHQNLMSILRSSGL